MMRWGLMVSFFHFLCLSLLLPSLSLYSVHAGAKVLGRAFLTADGMEMEGLLSVRKTAFAYEESGGLHKKATTLKEGLYSLPYKEFMNSQGFKYPDKLPDMPGIRMNIYLTDDFKDRALYLFYPTELSRKVVRKAATARLPRNQWIELTFWLPLYSKFGDWDIFLDTWELQMDETMEGLFIHSLSFIENDFSATENPVFYGLKIHDSYLDKPLVRWLLFIFLLLCLLFPLWRASHKISWRVLSVFMLPFFLGILFFFIRLHNYFDDMLKAELYGLESSMKESFLEMSRLGEGLEAAVIREQEGLKKDALVYIRKNSTPYDYDKFMPEFEDFLREKTYSRYLRVMVDNGKHLYYSERVGNFIEISAMTRLLHGVLSKMIIPEQNQDKEDIRRSWEPVLEAMKMMSDSLGDSHILEYYLNNPSRLFDFNVKQEISVGTRGTSFWTYFIDDSLKPPRLWYVNGTVTQEGLAFYLKNILSGHLDEGGRFQGLDFFLDGFRLGVSFPIQNEYRHNFSYFAAFAKLSTANFFQPVIENGEVFFYYGGLFAGLREYSLVLRAEGSPLFEKIRRSKDLFCILLPFIVLCFGLISFFLSGQITGTIRALERGLQRIEAGDLKNDIRVEGKEQFADLALQFNRLLGVLREKEKIAPFLSAMARNSITEQSPVSVREQVFVFFYGIRNLGDFPLSVQPELFEFFLSEAQNVVTLCGGQVDKFTGNAVLAVFKGEKGAVKALECADLLQNSRREKWPDQDFFLAAENNLPMIKTGIGIAFGPAVLGAVGAAARLDYTVIGNTVNVAARLETLPTDRDFAVFISGSVYEKLSSEDINNFTFKRLDDVSLKGKKELLTVYEVL